MAQAQEPKTTRLGSEDNLPLTRFQLLYDTLRFHFFDLVVVSLLTGLFFFPSWGWLIFVGYTDLGDPSNLASVALTYGVNAVFLAFAGLGMAGLFYFVKRLAWGVGTSCPADFFEGIKNDKGMFLLVYFVIGLLYALLRVDIASLTYGGMELEGWLKGLLEGLSYGVFFIFLLALLFVMSQAVTYEGSFFKLLSNGIRFVFGAFLTNVPMFLLYFLCFLLYEFVPSFIAQYVMMAFSTLFYFGFSAFAFTLYSHSLFDKSINKTQYPEIVRKGLRKSSDGGPWKPSDSVH
jgi:hypothetical protein